MCAPFPAIYGVWELLTLVLGLSIKNNVIKCPCPLVYFILYVYKI
jgi:hypothetical protein